MSARSIWATIGVVAALGATVAAVATAPDDGEIIAVFPVRGGIGDVLEARELIVEPTDIRLAERLEVGYGDAGNTSTEGVWVVLDATITPRLTTLGLSYSYLTIDGIQYRVADLLPYPSLTFLVNGAGIPQHGSLIFELPKSALDSPGAAHAEITLTYSFDPTLDSIPVVVVDLASLDVESRAVIAPVYISEVE